MPKWSTANRTWFMMPGRSGRRVWAADNALPLGPELSKSEQRMHRTQHTRPKKATKNKLAERVKQSAKQTEFVNF